ncbi:MAG TPA: hypothetical protein VIY30_16265, partial [Burkholderiaceae bacterium]
MRTLRNVGAAAPGPAAPRRPIEIVLARLEPYRLRSNGPDRWRARCPAHGGSNPSTLSIGIGDSDSVLLRCWHGCDVEQVARALGLELADLFPPKPEAGGGAGALRPRRLLTALQALEVIEVESHLACLAAHNLANGYALTSDDLARLTV